MKTKKLAAKKKHKKQHDVRGESFLRIAKELRAHVLSAGGMWQQEHLAPIIRAFENEGKRARKLR